MNFWRSAQLGVGDVVTNNLDLDRPAGWQNSELFTFIENCWSNSLASFDAHNVLCRRMEDIDAILRDLHASIAKTPVEDHVPAIIFGRLIGAYRSAVMLSLCLSTDAFCQIRSCLEHAAYASLIKQRPHLADVWSAGSETPQTLKTLTRAFSTANLRAGVAALAPGFEKVFDLLYRRSIDFGGHPNMLGVYAQVSVGNQDRTISVNILHADSDISLHTLRSCAQAGVFAAVLSSKTFPEAFRAAGLEDRLIRATAGL